MTRAAIMIDKDLIEVDISEDLKREITTYRKLKPLIGHCLTLNHDLNNPLAGILGYAEFLLANAAGFTAEQKSDLQQIVTGAERIQRIVTTLADKKIRLASEIDLEAVTATYQKVAEPLE